MRGNEKSWPAQVGFLYLKLGGIKTDTCMNATWTSERTPKLAHREPRTRGFLLFEQNLHDVPSNNSINLANLPIEEVLLVYSG